MIPSVLMTLLFVGSVGAQEYRAFWADAFRAGFKSPLEVDQLVDDLVTARCNAIFLEVRLDGYSYFTQSLEPPAIQDTQYSPGFDALEYTIQRAHARGIEVHAWFPVYPLWRSARPPVDARHLWHRHGPLAPGEDMWMSRSSLGTVSTSLDPGHPGVVDYLARIITEPVRHYALDGIHLDYVRYPEDADYGYNPVALERFARQQNRGAVPTPRDAAWQEFRRQQVTALVRQIYLRTLELNPQVKVSAAVITWGNGPTNDAGYRGLDAYSRVYQDWRGWLEEGILDLANPMSYFRESTNASFLDRWMEYYKDRSFQRGILVGLGNYLNPIAASLAQIRRAQAPSAGGNRALGFNLYSYATTNLQDAQGLPVEPNAEFYRQVGEWLGARADVPVLPWKARPVRGHLAGRLEFDSGPAWLADGVTVVVESDTGQAFSRRVATDATGFFGVVDLEPGRYRIRLERGGVEFHRTIAREVRAGEVARFEVRLPEESVAGALPSLTGANLTAAAPGDVLQLRGARLAVGDGYASAVPLPDQLGGAQVVVNGGVAPVFSASADQMEVQLPLVAAEVWRLYVRRAGGESAVLAIPAVEAQPRLVEARREGRTLRLEMTGLGLVQGSVRAGEGVPPDQLPLVRAQVRAEVAGVEVPVVATLAPYVPGRYWVTIALPVGMETGELTLTVATAPALRIGF
jgi:uncharacterized protein (TIGR03437 family)